MIPVCFERTQVPFSPATRSTASSRAWASGWLRWPRGLFAISTMISWSYYGEQGMVYMVGQKGVLPYKLVFLLAAIYAAGFITDTDDMIALMDLGTGAMLWANIPIVLFLGHRAVKCEHSYFKRFAAGEFKRRDASKSDDVLSWKDEE